MAPRFPAINSLIETISLYLGRRPRFTADDKELMDVIYGKLDSLRSLVDEIKTLEAQNTAFDGLTLASELRVEAILKIIKESQRTKAAFLNQIHSKTMQRRTKEKMAYAAITSFTATISMSLGHLIGDEKELMEVLYVKLDSLRTLVDETDKIIRDGEALKTLEAHTTMIAYTAEDMVELELAKQAAYTALLEFIQESQQRTKAAITSLRAALSPSKEEQTIAYTEDDMVQSELREQVAYTTEDMVESDMGELALSETEVFQGRSICKCLQQVIENVDSTAEEWMKMKNMFRNIKDPKHQIFNLGYSSQHLFESKNIIVGYDNELEMLMDQLVRGLRELKVISLVGMGGIGKTTFATRIFNEPWIMSHFDVRAKITLSQEYHVRNLYLGLLSYTSSRVEGLDEKNDEELADLLQKSLKGRRYLVIIDDIWTTQDWDEIKMCFPDHSNGSRILLTTRNTEVADYASSGTPPIPMRLLTFDECWNLLYHKVFQNECSSAEFEEIGKEIARKCQGLPLAIVVMAGVLSRIGRSLDEWKKVVEDMNLLMSTDLDHYCSRVLALSYYHLPSHLRACLLYFTVFKKSSDIPISKLVRLWAAEGFVLVNRDESFEMAAVKCLKDLIERSLVFVNSWSFCGKIKSCGVHDMIHRFCLEEAQSTDFLNIIMENHVQHRGSHQRRVSFQSLPRGNVYNAKLRSLLNYGRRFSTKNPQFFSFKLLRVLDVISVTFECKPDCIKGLFFLRYLAFTINKPSNTPDLADLKNLQSLTIQCLWHSDKHLLLPKEIWGMSQLRHLKSSLNYLADPPPENKSRVMEHLRTLSGLNPGCCTPSILQGISNVKRLQICGTKPDYVASALGDFKYRDFSHCHQLESLTITAEETKVTATSATLQLPPASAFPQNLKKLTLCATYLPWKEMRIVSELPKLEALKLERYACRGRKWETTEGGFPQLKFLLLECTGLVLWKTCSDHFPCLERLFLTDSYSLISIPQDFADIMTLQLIELDMCRHSAVNSAKQIQQEVGENVLHVRVKNPMDQEEEQEKESREEEEKEEEEEEGSTIISASDTTSSRIQVYIEKQFPNGDLYIGNISEGSPHGFGKCISKNGFMYEGEWRKGKQSGKGKSCWPSGETFEGEFKSNFREGWGTCIYSNGDMYKGSWSLDQKHGYGQLYHSSGDYYEGHWRRNKRHGHGRYVWKNGSQYEGHWRRNKILGHRKRYVRKNGNQYSGKWINGESSLRDCEE